MQGIYQYLLGFYLGMAQRRQELASSKILIVDDWVRHQKKSRCLEANQLTMQNYRISHTKNNQAHYRDKLDAAKSSVLTTHKVINIPCKPKLRFTVNRNHKNVHYMKARELLSNMEGDTESLRQLVLSNCMLD